MTVGIRGLGLIGGSFEKAFRAAGHDVVNLKDASSADIARCALVVTHDIFVAPFLQELGAGEFRSTHWIGFLQGAALFERPDGSWDVDYCVPDKSRWQNLFLQ